MLKRASMVKGAKTGARKRSTEESLRPVTMEDLMDEPARAPPPPPEVRVEVPLAFRSSPGVIQCGVVQGSQCCHLGVEIGVFTSGRV